VSERHALLSLVLLANMEQFSCHSHNLKRFEAGAVECNGVSLLESKKIKVCHWLTCYH
jgi:hypothetical protein